MVLLSAIIIHCTCWYIESLTAKTISKLLQRHVLFNRLIHRDGIMHSVYASATSIINSLASNKIIVTTPLTNNYTVTVDLIIRVIWFTHVQCSFHMHLTTPLNNLKPDRESLLFTAANRNYLKSIISKSQIMMTNRTSTCYEGTWFQTDLLIYTYSNTF